MEKSNFADPKSSVFYAQHISDNNLVSKAWGKKNLFSSMLAKLSPSAAGGSWKW